MQWKHQAQSEINILSKYAKYRGVGINFAKIIWGVYGKKRSGKVEIGLSKSSGLKKENA